MKVRKQFWSGGGPRRARRLTATVLTGTLAAVGLAACGGGASSSSFSSAAGEVIGGHSNDSSRTPPLADLLERMRVRVR